MTGNPVTVTVLTFFSLKLTYIQLISVKFITFARVLFILDSKPPHDFVLEYAGRLNEMVDETLTK